jgi:hypothetical protein
MGIGHELYCSKALETGEREVGEPMEFFLRRKVLEQESETLAKVVNNNNVQPEPILVPKR